MNSMDIDGVHHVGHVVRDIDAAAALYRRMGFQLPPPSFPVLPATAGQRSRVVGAGNSHVSFRQNFVELVTVAAGADPGDGAALVPLEVPDGAADRVAASIAATTARLAAALVRFAGLHILVLQSPDADAVAARMSAAGIAHSGVIRIARPGPAGTAPVPIGLVEIDGGFGPEGRIAVAEDIGGTGPEHPNGAVGLVGPTLCVHPAALDDVGARYQRLLGRPARKVGRTRVFDLDAAREQRVVVVGEDALDTVLPGERAPALPAFVAFTVRVRDLAATRELLDAAGLATRPTPAGGVLVPGASAAGCAVVFVG